MLCNALCELINEGSTWMGLTDSLAAGHAVPKAGLPAGMEAGPRGLG